MAPVERTQARCQPARRKGLGYVDRDALAHAQVLDLFDRVLYGAKGAVQAFCQHAARWRQDQALVMAHEHRFAKPVFKLFDLPTDRALGHVQRLPGLGKAAGADRNVEGTQGV